MTFTLMMSLALNLGIFSLSTFAPYYFKYITGNEEFMFWYTLFLGFGVFISAVVAPRIVAVLGKKKTYLFHYEFTLKYC